MWVKLSDSSPTPMFFVGEPKNLVLSLTYANPGPVTLEMDKLDRVSQLKILNALKNGVLESDLSFQDAFDFWSKSRPETPRTPEVVQAPVKGSPLSSQDTTYLTGVAKQRLALEAERKDKEEKFTARCDSILKGTFRALQAELAGETDTRLVRALIQKETAEKQRKIVVKFLKDKLVGLEKKIADKIAKEAAAHEQSLEPKPSHHVYTVIDSEQKTVVLTPDDLIRLQVTKRP